MCERRDERELLHLLPAGARPPGTAMPVHAAHVRRTTSPNCSALNPLRGSPPPRNHTSRIRTCAVNSMPCSESSPIPTPSRPPPIRKVAIVDARTPREHSWLRLPRGAGCALGRCSRVAPGRISQAVVGRGDHPRSLTATTLPRGSGIVPRQGRFSSGKVRLKVRRPRLKPCRGVATFATASAGDRASHTTRSAGRPTATP